MRQKKLDLRGFSHDIVMMLIVVVFAIGGVGYMVASHADAPNCDTLTIAEGSTNPTCVESVQRFIVQKDRDHDDNQNEHPDIIYGTFGTGTLAAVQEYQTFEGITDVNGEVDGPTWAKLCADISFWDNPANDSKTTEFSATTFHQYADPTGCVETLSQSVAAEQAAEAKQNAAALEATAQVQSAAAAGTIAATSSAEPAPGQATAQEVNMATGATSSSAQPAPGQATAQEVNVATGATPTPNQPTAQQVNTATGATTTSAKVTIPQTASDKSAADTPPTPQKSSIVDSTLHTISYLFTKTTSNIIDISYPQCGSESSLGSHDEGVIGVNGGGDFSGNGCLYSEVKHFSEYALYVNSNYPSSNCPAPSTATAAYNCGYDDGIWAVNYAKSQDAHSSTWWIDVETTNHWSSDLSLNSNFLYGLSRALIVNGASSLGYYSTSYQWGVITGGWKNSNPVWYATGLSTKPSSSTVAAYCSDKSNSFDGGKVWALQYVQNNTLDIDILC